jgi:hypothetical protein
LGGVGYRRRFNELPCLIGFLKPVLIEIIIDMLESNEMALMSGRENTGG